MSERYEEDQGPPLRILQVLEPSGGGAGRHFIDLCAGLAARGQIVTAIYSPVRAEDRFVSELFALPLHEVISLDMRRAVGPWDFGHGRALRQLIREKGPFDIVHGHSSKAGALTRLATLPGRSPPVLYTPHAFRTMDPTLGSKGRLVYGGVERLLGRFCSDRVICVSPDEYNHALDQGLPARILRIVTNGVAYPPSDQRAVMRAKFDLAADQLAFGFIGRFVAQKAPERLIRAFAEVADRMPNARLVMIGSGEREAEVNALIQEHGLANKIRIHGEIRGNDAIQAFDVLVAPSRYEAMSYAMLEAAAGGLPMVLSRVGGTSVVLEDGINGFSVPNSDDTGPLVEAMMAFRDPLTRARLAAGALAKRGNYRLETMVTRTLAVYRDLLPIAVPNSLIAAGQISDESSGRRTDPSAGKSMPSR
ncbi:glycosyltransferase [Allorhizobium taibaishanense]|uniref:Glycosyltransferase involved in cell wall biosynthesis n=1 Tax=Allorhizobium taibaishanense TaxID=887144 RepID=A0A7W6HLQ1_9HYPH|nr:glycosyltransferase [Allorhizobium taibaishanense]MBB4007555.1 glycosyltransferase involved in cell wall biosynthesis [Allorhizobium taibaishanense]